MDLKTLEYMEERTKKARGIASRIDNLKKYVIDAPKIDKIYLSSFFNNINIEEKEPIFVLAVAEQFQKVVIAEIKRLEKELAEL